MASFSAVVTMQIQLEDQFQRSWKNFKKTPRNRLTVGYLKARKSAIEELWREISQNYRQMQTAITEKDQGHPYLASKSMETLEDDYCEFLGSVIDKLEELENFGASQQPSELKPVETSRGASMDVKLPSITLPTFSGKYAEWISFRDLFMALIEQNSSLSLVQKMYYLKTNVSGEAEQLLRHFPITADSFHSAWEALQTRYHNKRALVTAHLQKLFSGLHSIPDTAHGLRRLLSLINENLTGLQSLEIDVKSWDPIIIFHVVQRLAKDTHELWEQALSSSSELPTLEAFTTFLEGRFRTLEALDATNSRSHTQNVRSTNPPRNSHAFHAASSSTTCVKCKGPHSIRQCPVFREFDAKARYSFVKEKKLCFNCMSENHGTRKCQSTQTCTQCNKRHHTLLHFDPNHPFAPSKLEFPTAHSATYHTAMSPQTTASRDHSNDSNSSNSKPFAIFDEPTTSRPHMHAFHIRQRPQTLLATVVFNAVSSRNVEYKVRALIDPGSQASFITESAVQMLRLSRQKTNISISGLGSFHSAQSHYKVGLTIHSHYEDFSLRVEALVLPTLTHWLPTHQLPSGLFSEFQSLTLADSSFFQPGPIDMILGADIYPMLIKSGIKRNLSNDIIAQETTLGWIVSGPCPITNQESNIAVFHNHEALMSNYGNSGNWRKFCQLLVFPKTS